MSLFCYTFFWVVCAVILRVLAFGQEVAGQGREEVVARGVSVEMALARCEETWRRMLLLSLALLQTLPHDHNHGYGNLARDLVEQEPPSTHLRHKTPTPSAHLGRTEPDHTRKRPTPIPGPSTPTLPYLLTHTFPTETPPTNAPSSKTTTFYPSQSTKSSTTASFWRPTRSWSRPGYRKRPRRTRQT